MTLVTVLLAIYILRLRTTVAVSGMSDKLALKYRKKYTGTAMRVLGVRAKYFGKGAKAPVLYVSNHRSLLDPVVELHRLDAHVLSKAEVSSYPLVGDGARLTGVIFVDRNDPGSRTNARQAIETTLAAGKSVLIYPEGTTSNLQGTLDFRAGGFQAAVSQGIPVVPVAIAYGQKSDYWHEMSTLSFFIRKFSKRRTKVAVSYGKPVRNDDLSTVVSACRSWIEGEVLRLEEILNKS